MNPTDTELNNNIIKLSATRIIEIMRGYSLNHIFGYGMSIAMRKASEEDSIRESLEKGEKPNYEPIRIPDYWDKDHWLYQHCSTPKEKQPNFDKPLIVEIEEDVYFYDQPKIRNSEYKFVDSPKLLRGITLNNCAFQGRFSIANINSENFIKLVNCDIGTQHKMDTDSFGLRFYKSNFSEVLIENISSIARSYLD